MVGSAAVAASDTWPMTRSAKQSRNQNFMLSSNTIKNEKSKRRPLKSLHHATPPVDGDSDCNFKVLQKSPRNILLQVAQPDSRNTLMNIKPEAPVTG
jgi:hypothetical protein